LPGIFERNATQRKHGYLLAANFAQDFQSSGADMRRISLFEYRGEDGKVSASGSRSHDFLFRVARLRNDGAGVIAGAGVHTALPDGTHVGGIDIG
jgi:hypothetical protein